MQLSSFSNIIYWKSCLFHIVYSQLLCCRLPVQVWVLLWAFYSVPLIYASVSVLVPYSWVSQVVLVVKNLPANAGDARTYGFNPWVGKIPWRRVWQSTLVFLPGELLGQKSLAAIVHGVTKSQTRLKRPSMHICTVLLWRLQVCIVWNQGAWCHQLCSSLATSLLTLQNNYLPFQAEDFPWRNILPLFSDAGEHCEEVCRDIKGWSLPFFF